MQISLRNFHVRKLNKKPSKSLRRALNQKSYFIRSTILRLPAIHSLIRAFIRSLAAEEVNSCLAHSNTLSLRSCMQYFPFGHWSQQQNQSEWHNQEVWDHSLLHAFGKINCMQVQCIFRQVWYWATSFLLYLVRTPIFILCLRNDFPATTIDDQSGIISIRQFPL